MPVRRDKRTGRLYFRTTIKFADGTKRRLFGTPGVPGHYHDLAQTRAGAKEAERRAIAEALMQRPAVNAAPAVKEAPQQKLIREHAEKFVDTYKPGTKESEKREERRILKSHLLPFFGEMTIEALRQLDVDTYAQRELDRGMSIKYVNNQLAVLSTLIKYVTGEKSKLRFKLAGMTGELRAIEPDEVERLLAAADDRYRVVLLLAVEAGLRAAEIRGLQWSDLKDGVVTVRRALDKLSNEAVAPKHNKSRTVPMSARLAEALDALPRHGVWIVSEADGSFVTYDDLRPAVNAIYERAGVPRPPKPLHACRHAFGTAMAKKVSLPVVQALLGHADVKTTLRYVDVGEAERAAIAGVYGLAATRHQAPTK